MTVPFDISYLLLAAIVLLAALEGLLVHLCFATHSVLRLLAEIRSTSSRSFDILASTNVVPDCADSNLIHFDGRTYKVVAPDDGPSPVRVDVQNFQETAAEVPLSMMETLPSGER